MKSLFISLLIFVTSFDISYCQMNCDNPPSGVNATDGTCCRFINISWNPVQNANGYKITRYGGPSTLTITTTNSFFEDHNTSPGNIYSYYVQAYGSCGYTPANHDSGFEGTFPTQPSAITGSTNVCMGDTNTYSVTNELGVYYSWLAWNGTVIGSGNSVDVSWSTSGLKSLSVTPASSCGTGTTTFKYVEVDSMPLQPSEVSGDTIVCLGSMKTYQVPSEPRVTYSWSVTGGSISGSGNSINVTWNEAGNQILSVTPSNVCGIGTTKNIEVSVISSVPMQPSDISGNTTVCLGDTELYSITEIPGVIYTWNATGGIISGGGDSVYVTWNTTGNQTLKVTPSNECGNGTSRQLSVAVKSIPSQPSDISGNTTVCLGDTESYSITEIPGVIYTWNATGGIISGGGDSIYVTWNTTGNQNLSVTPSNECGDGTQRQISVKVNSIPLQPSEIMGNTSACIANSEQYSITNVPGITYNWNATGGIISGSGNSINVTWNITGNQILTVIPSNECGIGTARQLIVNVYNIPTKPSTITGNTIVCTGISEFYSVINDTGVIYTWNATGGIVSGGGNYVNVTWNTIGNQILIVTPSNECGNGTSNQLDVVVKSIPSQPGTIFGELNPVINNTYNYEISEVVGAEFYNWNATGGNILGDTINVLIYWNTLGNQTVSVNAENNCGTSSQSIISVNVTDNPSDIYSTYNKTIKIYPNPAKEKLFITDLNMASIISIFSMSGQKLIEVNVQQGEIEINIRDLEEGMYIIRISDTKVSYFSKFLK